MKTPALLALSIALSVSASAGQGPARRAVAPPRPQAASGQSLPIRRVIIYSNGVAYIERRGTVTGRAEVALPFKQSQIDDALKSMIVLDLGNGTIGAVSYASSEPPSARLAEIPFSIAPEASGSTPGGIAAVLRQLQGARVAVSAGARSATGAVLTVEQRTVQPDPAKPGITVRSLVIATEEGSIEEFDLADVRSVRLVDENARRNVAEFADASAAARRRDANTIVVTSDGAGPRELVVGYTVAAPIWKTSYRVVIDDKGTPFFQGWAIVDNVSEDDWNDVALSLVSGTPITFVQSLQMPYYRHRPVVPVPGDVQLAPQGHEQAVENGPTSGKGAGFTVDGASGSESQYRLPGVPVTNPRTATTDITSSVAENVFALNANVSAAGYKYHPSLSSRPLGESTGVTAAASGEQVGDLFEYRVKQSVSLDRNRSALIPIVQTRLEGARVSVYNKSIRAERPMSAMRLKNTSSLTFEGGPMTMFEGDSYVGESIIDRFKPGEERFVPFALDLGTYVSVTADSGNGPVFLVRAVQGSIDAQYYQFEKQTYTVRNQTDRPRVLYVEHPIRSGWELAEGTPAPAQRTPGVYRFRLVLEPGQVQTLTVSERNETSDSFALDELTTDEVNLLLARRYIDEPTRQALMRIVDMRLKLAAIEAGLESSEEEVDAIEEDQKRLRENIDSLKSTSEARTLIARYIAKADSQETRLEQIESERKAAKAEQTRLQSTLAAAIRDFTLDRRLSNAEAGAGGE